MNSYDENGDGAIDYDEAPNADVLNYDYNMDGYVEACELFMYYLTDY